MFFVIIFFSFVLLFPSEYKKQSVSQLPLSERVLTYKGQIQRH